MRRILIIDCFDSFTYNIFHYLDSLNEGNCEVLRYDGLSPSALEGFTHLVISPGPGLPSEYPLLSDVINKAKEGVRLLGVCLGLQAIVLHFGGRLINLQEVLHGVSSRLDFDPDCPLFTSIGPDLEIGHYHSWVASDKDLPKEFRVSSRDESGSIMSLEHRHLPIHAVQFHPESVMTTGGQVMLKNWLEIRSS